MATFCVVTGFVQQIGLSDDHTFFYHLLCMDKTSFKRCNLFRTWFDTSFFVLKMAGIFIIAAVWLMATFNICFVIFYSLRLPFWKIFFKSRELCKLRNECNENQNSWKLGQQSLLCRTAICVLITIIIAIEKLQTFSNLW